MTKYEHLNQRIDDLSREGKGIIREIRKQLELIRFAIVGLLLINIILTIWTYHGGGR